MPNFYDLSVIESTPHHQAMSDLVDLLCHRTGNINRAFFQVEVAYFLGLIPSSMRTKIKSPERGVIPINIYSIGLATSGFGKGHSVSVMEEVLEGFREDFMESSFNEIAEDNLFKMATKIAATKGTDEAEELKYLMADFKRQGHPPFIFDSGTGPAVKQLRYKLLLAKAGGINLQMDEIGSNLVGNSEVLNVLLELYDLGKIKAKLVKNTADNERGLDIVGTTPANALMFGTSSKLFDGSKTEEEFYSFLATGYARRCFFGIGNPPATLSTVKPVDVYDALVSKNKSLALNRWKSALTKFADPQYYDLELDVPKQTGVELVAYRLQCEALANDMAEHEEIRKAELSHRYFKAMKLAGVYAFLDEESEISVNHVRQAIKVAEESGKSFEVLLTRERNFVRLAKYIASSADNLTHADLVEDLPYYPTSTSARREMMDLAMAWGVSNHVVITKNVVQQVEFFSGSNLEETDLSKLSVSYSDSFAYDYQSDATSVDKLPILLKAPNLHWCNHSFKDNHRKEENAIPGFNTLVVDVDGHIRDKEGNVKKRGVTLEAVHDLLKDFTFITSTTKRHTEEEHRFRLVMPTNFVLNLESKDYKEFINSFLMWLPFESDEGANQRSKKWMTSENSIIHVHRGPQLVDVLPFIPKTKQNTEYVKQVADLGNLDNLERWFLNNLEVGGRNNTLLSYAMMLKDAGATYSEIETRTTNLNQKSSSPLKLEELQDTVFKSVAQKMGS